MGEDVRTTIVFLIILLFNSCSFKGMVIDKLPYLITFRVDQNLFLTSEQEDQFKKELKSYLIQNKSQVREIYKDLTQVNFSDDTKSVYLKLRSHYLKLVEPFSLILAKYIVSLDNEQQKYFFEKANKDNRKYREKFQKERLERVFDRFERFLSDLTPQQENIIKENSSHFETLHNQWIKRRVNFQVSLKAILAQKSMPQIKIENVAQLMTNYLLEGSKVENRAKAIEVVDKIKTIASKEQQEHFKNTISELEEWLNLFEQTY